MFASVSSHPRRRSSIKDAMKPTSFAALLCSALLALPTLGQAEPPTVKITTFDNHLHVEINGSPFTDYWFGAQRPAICSAVFSADSGVGWDATDQRPIHRSQRRSSPPSINVGRA